MKVLNQVRNQLGESPFWHPMHRQFFWVDITGKKIHTLHRDSQQLTTIELPDKVGCIVPADNGHLVAALEKTIVEVALPSGEIRVLSQPVLPEGVMFNDGKVDCHGRLWVGSKDMAEQNPIAALYCFDGEKFHVKQTEVTVSNGTDWNLDNTVMYYTDSPRQTIVAYPFDAASATLGEGRVFATINNGYPDGLTVDSQGNLWSAHWDGRRVTCYDPNGHIVKVVEMAARRPTSCCFGGDDYDQFFVTSAAIGLNPSPDENDGYPFIIDNLATGRPAHLFQIRK